MIETQSHEDTKEILENPLSYKIIGRLILSSVSLCLCVKKNIMRQPLSIDLIHF